MILDLLKTQIKADEQGEGGIRQHKIRDTSQDKTSLLFRSNQENIVMSLENNTSQCTVARIREPSK